MTALYQFKDQNMSITLTEKAAQRVRTFLENRGKGIGLRLGVKTSGCSGLGYVLEFVDVLNDDDLVFVRNAHEIGRPSVVGFARERRGNRYKNIY